MACNGTALLFFTIIVESVPVAARSNVSGVVGSNPGRDMNVCVLCLYVVLSCVGRGLRDGPITRPNESYQVSRLRNVRCEAARVLTRIVEPLMMMMMMMMMCIYFSLNNKRVFRETIIYNYLQLCVPRSGKGWNPCLRGCKLQSGGL
jgi:hypothetical protein